MLKERCRTATQRGRFAADEGVIKMKIQWKYPIFILPHGGGYASLVDPSTDGPADQYLVVCTAEDEAAALMRRLGILGHPRPLHSAREFAWLLQCVRAPVKHVAFDPDPLDDEINSAFAVPIRELLERRLRIDNSPWDYPVYAVGLPRGFLCIAGSGEGGLTAVALFRGREQADAYLEKSEQSGDLCEMEDRQQVVKFLTALRDRIDAVAIDPDFQEGRSSAKHCLSISILLDKYLVDAPPPKDA